ncbi:MAG: hypothetical protein UT24_C0020G0012 [Candidatus Woesebacteria bacterium GW2011_GWB1_39_12]|uniref:Uncharacterized protein n=1 Tax=Candidatus Woesebacteria bacterium GW2011_GWB1_39_12 TaxID=1618574 RepID=A0A0G0PP56_9BACT|nr:MAG: hypothetical protein UT24_C0020G0012 [Candidatus Woesebacteria bacterium GW2011_GWB1_39_12]
MNENEEKSPEEIAEALKTQLEEKEKVLVEKQAEIEKLKDKEFNFKRLRDMTEEELGRLSVVEKSLMQKQEKLEEESKSFASKVIESHKNDSLAVLVGDDADMKKKVLFHYERLKDEAVTKEEIASKMREAWLLAGGIKSFSTTPISGGLDSYYPSPTSFKKGTELTETQKELAKAMGIKDEDLKKYNK